MPDFRIGLVTILRERKVWRKAPAPRPWSAAISLDRIPVEEEGNVLAAVKVLRRRYRSWKNLADAMRMPLKTLERIVSGKDRRVPAALAIRVAKVAGVPVDDILSGAFPGARACPHCGRGPR